MKRLSPTAIWTLAEIHVNGVWMWSPPDGKYPGAAYLDNPQRTPLRASTVAILLRDGYLVSTVGREGDDAVKVSDVGLDFLRTQPDAVGRAQSMRIGLEAVNQIRTGERAAGRDQRFDR